jgi:hypothetical protein
MFYLSAMARPLRIDFPGGIFHVTSRGNAKAEIFCDDADCRGFLEVVADSVKRFNWLCHAYYLCRPALDKIKTLPAALFNRQPNHSTIPVVKKRKKHDLTPFNPGSENGQQHE